MNDHNLHNTLLGKIAAYTEILVKDPRSTIFVSLAETYRKMGLFDDARQIIEKGTELHPGFGPAYIVLARILCQQKDYDSSVSMFERALDLDPESLAALVGYARVRILLGQDQAARDLLLKARDLSPADPVINKLLLSLQDDATEEFEGADESVEEAESAMPLASVTLAELYLKQGLTEKALTVYQDLSAQAPDDLNLRRKIKELESPLEEETLPEEPFSEGATVEEDIETTDNIESEMASISEETSLDSSTPLGDSIDPVLEKLNQWLENIQKRRDHV